jgi:predicted adenine nucleotide alpha hydrolase (AANH) superfamily ATPase
MKLLLHCCCAPCSVSCIGSLSAENIFPQLFWYNPNIHPYTEYKSRRDCLNEFAKSENLNLTIIDEYGLREFLNEVFLEGDNFSISQHARCKKCYRIRLEKTASFAAQEGYSAFSTTLLISPYQNHDEIKLLGEELSGKYGVDFLFMFFRPLFREGQSAARSKNMYMQKYCGCIFSEEERYLSSDVTRKDEKETANG